MLRFEMYGLLLGGEEALQNACARGADALTAVFSVRARVINARGQGITFGERELTTGE